MPNVELNLTNQYGETSKNVLVPTSSEAQGLSDALPAKTGITGIAALATDADLPTAVLKINAILAALKVTA